MAEGQPVVETYASFCFVVEVGKDRLGAFTECTLPSIDWDIEEVKEGGLNSYVHQLPGQRKAGRLTLKNGVGKSELWLWCTRVMGGSFERKPIAVKLLDGQRNQVALWYITNACPVKWTGPQLTADATTVAIQTIEFSCGEIMVEPNDGVKDWKIPQ